MSSVPHLHPTVTAALLGEAQSVRHAHSGAAQLVLNRALRDRADGAKHVLAAGAMDGGSWDDALRVAAGTGPTRLRGLDPDRAPWWRALGRITLLHALTVEDEQLATQFFDVAGALDGHAVVNLGEYLSIAQALWDTGQHRRLRKLPPPPVNLGAIEREFILLDICSKESGPGSRQWVDQFNARVLEPTGLAPLELIPHARSTFDRLACASTEPVADGPLITVIMTTFRRDSEILTAVQSVLAQTWQNFELLVVDDCSGPEFDEILEIVESLDDRVRVIRQDENGGTYVGRNTALSQAKGEFVTFQDDDDWSHPERLERQILPLLESRDVHSTLSFCVRANEELQFRYAAVTSSRVNSSSLMCRRQDAIDIGGFDTVRKGGDSEFIRRLCEKLPGRQVEITSILAVVRLTQGSLSRTDFGAGWNHPSRSEYWESAKWWHKTLDREVEALATHDHVERAFPAPRRFLGSAPLSALSDRFDVVLLGDFANGALPGSRTAGLLSALLEAHERVAIIHLDSPSRTTGRPTRIAVEVRALIHEGKVERLLPTDEVSVSRLIVADAEIMSLRDSERWAVTVEEAVHMATTPPAEAGGASLWSVADSVRNTEGMFGVAPAMWVSTDSATHAALRDVGVDSDLIEYAGAALSVTEAISARRYRGARPVLGRIAPRLPGQWPTEKDELRTAYPVDGTCDVRVRGEAHTLRAALSHVPAAWLWIDPEQGSLVSFLQGLDFYVYQGENAPDASETAAILASVSIGRVVVMGTDHARFFGEMVLAADPHEVKELVADLHFDRRRYHDQVEAARTALHERFPLHRLRAALDALTAKSTSEALDESADSANESVAHR